MNSTHGSGTVKAVAEHATVIYDEKTGAIKHIHRTIILEGGVVPSETAMEKAAMEIVSKRISPHGLKVIHADPSHIRLDVKQRVDPQQRILIERP